MAKPDRLTFVGELWAVTVADDDGSEIFVEVAPAILGVARGMGLVTCDTKKELERGLVHRNPSAERPRVLVAIWYYRPRRSGAWWFHDTPRALVTFDGEDGDGRPFVFLDSRGSVPCGTEAFVCK